jgi:molecular chaperone DnaK
VDLKQTSCAGIPFAVECRKKFIFEESALGKLTDDLLLDLTPLTLSVEIAGGVCMPIINRNTPIPCSRSIIITTIEDNQPSVELHIVQGERPMAADNRSLYRILLDDILPAPRCVPRIVLTLEIDANGFLRIKAHDKGTSREQKITITASSGLSRNEVERIRREAELYAEEDNRIRRRLTGFFLIVGT